MIKLSHDDAYAFLSTMTEAQLGRVLRRVSRHSAAFHDIRDAAAQAVVDELHAIRASAIDHSSQAASDLADDLHNLMKRV